MEIMKEHTEDYIATKETTYRHKTKTKVTIQHQQIVDKVQQLTRISLYVNGNQVLEKNCIYTVYKTVLLSS